jgi:hypothetical protein
MNKTLFTIALLIGSFTTFAQGFTSQKGGHCYTMDIPDYMLKTYELNDVASLQYINSAKEAYVIVIEDVKEQLQDVGIKFSNAKDFLKHFTADYKKDAKKRKLSSITEFESNGNGHAQVELSWKEDDTDFYMLITAVESKTHFYKVMCWTTVNNLDLLKEDFLTMSKTIKD